MWRTSTFPVISLVIANSWTAAEGTEEQVPPRIDHNSSVTMPHNQISWLRPPHTFERLNPTVQVGGIRVLVREPGSVIHQIDEVRAIAF